MWWDNFYVASHNGLVFLECRIKWMNSHLISCIFPPQTLDPVILSFFSLVVVSLHLRTWEYAVLSAWAVFLTPSPRPRLFFVLVQMSSPQRGLTSHTT